MLLAINIGNTSIWGGIFEGVKLLHTFRLESKGNISVHTYQKTIEKQIKNREISDVAISSVVSKHNPRFTRICLSLFGKKPIFVHEMGTFGKDVGADIICNTQAVANLYGGPALVVDLGTATTFDAVGEHGKYLGSAIAPGMQISHQALIKQTALLHEVPLKAPKSVIGTTTTTAIQSGVVLGYTSLVEGMIERFKNELGQETKVVATGGLCEILNKHTKLFDHVDPFLTLRGIQILYQRKIKLVE